MTDDEMRRRAEAAEHEVDRLCAGGRWRMRIPTEDDDSDIVLSAALALIPKLLDRVGAAEAEVERLQRIIDGYDRTPAEQRAADAEAKSAALRATVERVRGELTEPHTFAPSSDIWELGYARGYNNAREAIRLLTARDGGER